MSIAYQVIGEGPVDLIFVPFMINLVWAWERPIFVEFCRRLADFSRLILLDKRGTGLSDRPKDLPSFETRMDDIRAVMDDAGSERAALLGAASAGGQLCAVFAATCASSVKCGHDPIRAAAVDGRNKPARRGLLDGAPAERSGAAGCTSRSSSSNPPHEGEASAATVRDQQARAHRRLR